MGILFNFKKITALVLLAAILTVMAVGCAEKSGEDTGVPVTNASDETTAPETQYIDTVPADIRYDGYNFRIGWGTPYDINESAYTLEEAGGDIIHEAVYERNRKAEERLDIKISAEKLCDWTALLSHIQTLITAGDCPYDSFCASAWFMFQCSINGYLTSLYDLPTLDLDHDWWDKETIGMYNMGSQSLYFVSGMINYLDDYATTAMYFNKNLCDDNSLTYPYDMVRSGDWTFDSFNTLVKSFGSDVNGDGVFDENDTYGFLENTGGMTRMFNSAGISVLNIDETGAFSVNSSERVYEVFGKIFNDIFTADDTNTIVVERKIGYDKGELLFPNGQVLFLGCSLVGNIATFRQTVEDDFGVIPFPKFDEAQEKYYGSYNTAWGTVYAVPTTNTLLEQTGWILDVMGSFSRDTVNTAVIEKSVLTKATRDDDSAEMLELIFTTKFFELGQWGSSVYGQVCSQVQSGKDNLASALASVEAVTEKEFAAVQEYYKFQ